MKSKGENMRDNFFIKDPIHKEINVKDKIIRELIKTKEFDRLKRIYQLGLAYKLFPSATHTRYAHCLGTYEVVSKFTNALKNNPKSKTKISDKEALTVAIAGLLHDIGHGPFSHVFESINPNEVKHEEWTLAIIKNPDSEINKVLKKYNININDVCSIIKGTYKKKWMTQLISSDVDADRIDYLLRDSYFIGTHYGTIDLDILLKRVNIIDNTLCFSESCSTLIKSFWYSRIHMNTDVYENKNTLIFEWILILIFKRLKELKTDVQKHKDKIQYYNIYSWLIMGGEISVNDYVKMDDSSFFCFLDSLKSLKIDSLLTSLLQSFQTGDGFSYIFSDSKKIKTKNSYVIDKEYVYKEWELNRKKIFSLKSNGELDTDHNIWLYNEERNHLIRFSKSKLYNSLKNSNEEISKIILINEKFY